MSGWNGFVGIIDDVARGGGRLFQKQNGPKYQGEFASPQFFSDLHAGDNTAMEMLKHKNYDATWAIPSLRASAEREMTRSAGRSFFQKAKPRGILTGYGHYG